MKNLKKVFSKSKTIEKKLKKTILETKCTDPIILEKKNCAKNPQVLDK